MVCLAEQAPWAAQARFALHLARHPRKLAQAIGLKRSLLGIRQLHGAWPVRAEGEGSVERVVLHQDGHEITIPCDVLACGFGLAPNVSIESS